ncbi:glycosyltransferase family 2 protein [Flavobacterium soyae]|uniref:Glycosyltransferase n=1 Tax=Flavobacterium soyae TaxID=2903098 RepID=A0ABZ2UIU6_9FLAO|nr:glycosyltransferase [Flavobacterium soyae]MCD9575265.1 glycosyltransferase [Flavobacterium soyae]
MENNNLVSIIMPAYNVAKYIQASIDTVLNQTYTNWELIIVDDGSIDDTAKICKKYLDTDNRIKYIYQNNAKQAKARNNGIQIAKGDIIAFLDADDLWLPNKLELSLSHFDLNIYDLIFTDSYYSGQEQIDVSDLTLEKMRVQNGEYFGPTSICDFLKMNKIPILTVLVKKAVLEKVGSFDEKCVPAEDYDLWLRLLKNNCKFKAINIPLSIYRFQENSSTASDRLATNAVLELLMKNFTIDEVKRIKAVPFIKSWIIRWIQLYLAASNISQLQIILNHFNFNKFPVKITFILGRFISIDKFKKIIIKAI